ncbi:MAG: hypothetical protein ABI641_00495 [Caldimonas sp.]
MTAAEIAHLRERGPGRGLRVAVVETAAGPVVVKAQRRARSVWRGRAVNVLARTFGLGLLQAVPAHGGAAAQAIEVERLGRLRTAGVKVPRVLRVEPDFIVLEHVAGPSLVDVIQARPADLQPWARGLAAVVDVHVRGAYLSQAFARNVLVAADGSLVMIDFEDDPLEVMTLDQAQARDWLTYLHSTLWLLRAPAERLRTIVAEQLGRERPAVRAEVERAGRRLAVLRLLPGGRRPWGREVVGARALADLFHSSGASQARAST